MKHPIFTASSFAVDLSEIVMIQIGELADEVYFVTRPAILITFKTTEQTYHVVTEVQRDIDYHAIVAAWNEFKRPQQ